MCGCEWATVKHVGCEGAAMMRLSGCEGAIMRVCEGATMRGREGARISARLIDWFS